MRYGLRYIMKCISGHRGQAIRHRLAYRICTKWVYSHAPPGRTSNLYAHRVNVVRACSAAAKVTTRRFFQWMEAWPRLDSSWTADFEVGRSNFRWLGTWLDAATEDRLCGCAPLHPPPCKHEAVPQEAMHSRAAGRHVF